MKQYHRNQERNAALIAHVAKGGKACEIRNRLGMSEAASDAVLHRARKSGRLSPAPKLHGDDARERDAGIRKMLDAGLSQAEIARRLCVSANTVIGAVDRMRKRGELISGENGEKTKIRLPHLGVLAEADRLIAGL
jgi:transposase